MANRKNIDAKEVRKRESQISRYAPSHIVAFLSGRRAIFVPTLTLYEVNEECDRYISAGRLNRADAANGLATWAAQRMAASDYWTHVIWAAFDEMAQVDDTSMATFLGMSQIELTLNSILQPAIGGTKAWRASESEQARLVEEIDRTAEKLLGLLTEAEDLDVGLASASILDPRCTPLAKYSFELESEHSRKRLDAVREASAKGGLTRQLVNRGTQYVPPRLSTFLRTLRARANSTIPTDATLQGVSSMTSILSDLDLSEKDSADLAERFGIRLYKPGQPVEPPKLVVGGDFTKYPNRKQSLRHAVLQEIAECIFAEYREPPTYKASALIDAFLLAWFDDSPGEREIDNAVRERRKRQKNAAPRRVRLHKAYADAKPGGGKVGKKNTEIPRRRPPR